MRVFRFRPFVCAFFGVGLVGSVIGAACGGVVVDGGPHCTAASASVLRRSSCTLLPDLEAAVTANCAAISKDGVASFAPQVPCAGNFRGMRFTCCTADGACDKAIEEVGETSCKDVETWHRYASMGCNGSGKTLKEPSFSVLVPCGGVPGYLEANYACCPP